jgi:hypothetical protein
MQLVFFPSFLPSSHILTDYILNTTEIDDEKKGICI